MPQVITNHDSIIEAIKHLDLTSELFTEQDGKLKYERDLDVIVRGKDYANGKRVGPYFRLLTFASGEAIMRQGDWGGNTLYIAVAGGLDVLVKDQTGAQRKISE